MASFTPPPLDTLEPDASPSRMLGRITDYGQRDDPHGDSLTRAGRNAIGGQLGADSLAVSPDIEQQFRAAGIKIGDRVKIRLADGSELVRRWDDRTAQDAQILAGQVANVTRPLRGRFDLFSPGGKHAQRDVGVIGFEPLAAAAKFTPPPLDSLETPPTVGARVTGAVDAFSRGAMHGLGALTQAVGPLAAEVLMGGDALPRKETPEIAAELAKADAAEFRELGEGIAALAPTRDEQPAGTAGLWESRVAEPIGGLAPIVGGIALGGQPAAFAAPFVFGQMGYNAQADAAHHALASQREAAGIELTPERLTQEQRAAELAGTLGGAVNVALSLPVIQAGKSLIGIGRASGAAPQEAVAQATRAAYTEGGMPKVLDLLQALRSRGVTDVEKAALTAELTALREEISKTAGQRVAQVATQAAVGGLLGGGTQLAQNAITQSYEPGHPLFAGVPEMAAATALVPGVLGGTEQALAAHRARQARIAVAEQLAGAREGTPPPGGRPFAPPRLDAIDPEPAGPAGGGSAAQTQFESGRSVEQAVQRGASTIVIGAKGVEFPATYALVPTAQIQTSHSGELMAANPSYRLTNTRDYSDQAEKDKQLDTLNNFDPRRHVTDSPDAAVGPSIVGTVIDENGEASLQRFGGNNRGYAIANLPAEKRAELQALQNAKAAQFGVPSSDLPDAELVRHIGTFDFRKPGERERAQAIVDALNPSPGMVQGTAKRAEIDAAVVPIEQLAPLRMDIAPADAQAFVQGLIASGLADRNLTAPIAGSASQAQDYTQRLLVNAAFRQPLIAEARGDVRSAATTVRGMIDAAVPALVQMRAQPDGAGVADAIARAFTTTLNYLDQGGDKLPTALDRAAQQSELDPEHAVAQQLAGAMRAALVLDKAGKSLPAPSTANLHTLFDTIANAVAHRQASPDLFGNSESVGDVVRRALAFHARGSGPPETVVSEETAAAYVARKGITAPERRAGALAAIETLHRLQVDEQLEFDYNASPNRARRAAAVSAGNGGSQAPAATPEQRARADLLARISRGEAVEPARIAQAFVEGRTLSAIFHDAIRYDFGFDVRGSIVQTPHDFAVLNLALRNPYFESLRVAALDARGKIVASGILHVGTLSESIADPIAVVRWQQRHAPKARRIIIAHNHPSGITEPSSADRSVTHKMRDVLKHAGLELVDHVITNGDTYYSFEGQSSLPFTTPTLAPWELTPLKGLQRVNDATALAAITATLRTGDPQALHIIYVNTQLAVTGIERLPSGAGLSDLQTAIARGAAREGSARYLMSFPGTQASEGHVLQYLKANPISNVALLDASFRDLDSARAAGLVYESPAASASNDSPNVREDSPLRAVDERGNPYNIAVPLAHADKIRIIEMPELVGLARHLTGSLPQLKRMRGARGQFAPIGTGQVRLDPRIFADPISAAKTLAHEIGHLVDYLPQHTMTRGNVLGRLFSLRKFLQERYGVAAVGNKELRAELLAWTQYWKPYDPATAPKSYVRYRESAVELYADSISGIFVSPGEFKRVAPKFYREFFRGLDTKPEVKDAFFHLQAWLHRPAMARLKDRAFAVDEMFARAEEIFERKWQERQQRYQGFRGWLSRFKQAFFDNLAPIRDRAASVGDRRAEMLFDEHPLSDNLPMRWLERIHRTVLQPAEEAGFSMDDVGRQLFFDRIANESFPVSARIAAELGIDTGGRTVIANPQGHTPQTAHDALLATRLEHGIARQTLLDAVVRKFHDEVFEVMREAFRVGLLTPAQMEIIAANRQHYATFTPLEYIENYLPSGMMHQAGTLKEIQNPFVSTVSKLITLHRAIELQRIKAKTVEILRNHFPDEIAPAETVKTPDGREQPRAPRERGVEQIMLRRQGKPVWFNVPREIALMFERPDIPLLDSALQLLEVPFRRLFYPLFITYNPLFQLVRNPVRDARRSFVNAPQGIGLWDLARQLPLLKQVGPNPALDAVRAFIRDGTHSPLIAEMLENLAITPGDATFAVTAGQPVTSFDRLLQRFGILPEEEAGLFKDRAILQPIRALADAVRTAGQMNELLPKASVYRILTQRLGWTPRDAAAYVRNYIGTPNFTRRGKHIAIGNTVWPFLNVWMKGWAADLQLATRGHHRATRPDAPGKSRASWWFRWTMTSGVWTVLKVAATLGLLGAGLKKLFDGVSDHYKTNYDVLPLGNEGTSDFSAEGKVAFIPIPKDPTDRLVSGLLYNTLRNLGLHAAQAGLFGPEVQELNAGADARIGAALTRNLSLGASDMPGINPLLKIGGGWSDYLQGQNPVDRYRGSFVLSDAEHLAGGWNAVKPMLAWTYSQSGLQGFLTYDPDAGTTLEMTATLPIVNGMVKISDYGYREAQQASERLEDAARARLKLDLPGNVQQLAGELSFLRQIGKDDRTPDQQARYELLNTWDRRFYRPAFDTLSNAADNALDAGEKRIIISTLEAASRDFQRPAH